MTPHDRRYFWGPEVAEVIKRGNVDVLELKKELCVCDKVTRHKVRGDIVQDIIWDVVDYLKEKGII